MTLPAHYRSLYLSFLRLSCWMVFFGLISGILFQESTRKIQYGDVAPGIHWESVSHLALLHGHVFLIGVLIPLAVLGMLQAGLLLEGKTVTRRVLDWGGRMYFGGVILTVLLLLYKGYHYVLSVRMGELDFVAIEQGFFAGQTLLRHLSYGAAHVGMGVGLIILTVGILRALPKSGKLDTVGAPPDESARIEDAIKRCS